MAKPQDKLNLNKIREKTETHIGHDLLKLGAEAIQGAGAGLAGSGVLVTLIGLAGISVAFAYEVLLAAIGAVVFGVVAIVMAAYQLQKEKEHINQLLTAFNDEEESLKKSLINSLRTYGLTIETIKAMSELLSASGNNPNPLLDEDLNLLKEKKTVILQHLQYALSLIHSGDNSIKGALLSFFENNEETMADSLSTLNPLTVSNIIEDIANLSMPTKNTQPYHAFLKELSKPQELKNKNPHVKRINYVFLSIGAFLAGSGTTVTIASLFFGAALASIAGPVLVTALSLGALTVIASIFFYRKIEKRQHKVANELAAATGLTRSIRKHLKHNIGKENNLNPENNTQPPSLASIRKVYLPSPPPAYPLLSPTIEDLDNLDKVVTTKIDDSSLAAWAKQTITSVKSFLVATLHDQPTDNQTLSDSNDSTDPSTDVSPQPTALNFNGGPSN